MIKPFTQESDEAFTPPGLVEISQSALSLARGFYDTAKAMGGDWVVTFSWSRSISVKREPNEPYEDIGACLSLGAFKRHEIPAGFIQVMDGFEFAVQIPKDVWKNSVHRLIDIDETLLFKLALR